MFDIGAGELLLMLVVLLVVFGPKRLPELAGHLGALAAKMQQLFRLPPS